MGECRGGGQGNDQDDVGLAAFRPLSNLNPIKQRPDDVRGLRARRVVGQKGGQFADLFGVELADIQVHFYRAVFIAVRYDRSRSVKITFGSP